MSKFINRLFGERNTVAYTKSNQQLSDEAYEKFKSEGPNQQNENPTNLYVVSEFEKAFTDVIKGQSSSANQGADSAELPLGKVHNPERLKRERFVEGISKDLVELDDSITQNAMFVKQSREQLKRFKAFAQNAQIDIDVMYRLRDENIGLSGDLAHARKKTDSLKSELQSEKSKSLSAGNRYTEVRSALEKARDEIIDLIERDAGYRVELERYAFQASQRETELLQLNRSVEKFEVENGTLNEQYERVVIELKSESGRCLEFEKNTEELTAKLAVEQDLNENLVSNNRSHTQETETLRADNVELKSRLINVEHESAEIDKRNKEKYRITDDELYSLRTRVEGLQSQLRVKSQMNRDLQEQARMSLAEAKVSKEATKDLHDRLVETMRQHEQDQEQISDLNGEIVELNARFEKLLVEMEQSRTENVKLHRSLRLQKQAWSEPLDNGILVKKNKPKQNGKPSSTTKPH